MIVAKDRWLCDAMFPISCPYHLLFAGGCQEKIPISLHTPFVSPYLRFYFQHRQLWLTKLKTSEKSINTTVVVWFSSMLLCDVLLNRGDRGLSAVSLSEARFKLVDVPVYIRRYA